MNFLTNAVKCTKSGYIKMGYGIEREGLRIYVEDTGIGIPDDLHDKVFTRFEKLNAFVQGTGLGLPICQSIVERLGGRIEVESELGKGSVFALYLPYRQIHSSADKGTAYKAGQKRILVVEDIEVNFMQINAFLKKEYTILWVTNGEEAVKSFLRDTPDLI